MSERQKIFLAIVLSLLLHVFAFVFLVVWNWFMPEAVARAKPRTNAGPVVVTIMPPKPRPAPQPIAVAKPTPPPKVQRSMLDTEGLAKAEKPPEKPLFEAAENSRAASELPPTGFAPLPSQMGKDRPAPEFATHDFSLGKGTQPSSSQASTENPAQPKPTPAATPTPAPTATPPPEPVFKPTPVPVPKQTPPPPNAFAMQKPTPVPLVASPTPTPTPSATPLPDELPKPTPVPTATPKPMDRLAMLNQQPALRTNPTTDVRRPASEPGYQAQKQQTKIEGSISNRGKAGVDAVGTPLGLYRKRVADAIGSRWYYYVNQRMDLITVGDVHIKFSVNEKGRVEDVKILSNTGNGILGQFCVQSVTEARIPPLPPDVAENLQNGKLEIEYHFTIYPN